jgi:hypothetical protein
LLPDGTPSELSISRVMRARGTVRDVSRDHRAAEEIEAEAKQIEGDRR